MYLDFDYRMKISYSLPVERCHFTIKCIPKDDERQRLLRKKIEILPATEFSEGEDSYGNKTVYGCVRLAHDSFLYHISGTVELLQTEYEEHAAEGRIGIYRYPHGMCVPGEGLIRYFDTLELDGCTDDYEKCLHIMHRLHEDFHYAPSRTEVTTGAEEAWRIGAGVCQDYAHIYIALLRRAGVPARYVCGLLAGEGASHAWVEALCGGCWIGLDPTNDCAVDVSHIKLGDGRDASECAINRGIMLGGGVQTQEIYAMVAPAGRQAAAAGRSCSRGHLACEAEQ